MSHTLRRLRALFEDPLFVRGGRGVVMTPRAEALAVPLRAGLMTLRQALDGAPSFEPHSSDRTFRVVSPDLFDTLMLPRLLDRLAEFAPSVNLTLMPRVERRADKLATGELDLAISPVLLDADGTEFGERSPPDLLRRTLFTDSFRCFVRRAHPALNQRRRLTLRRFLSFPHVMVSPTGGGAGLIDQILDRAKQRRRVALRVPTFASALAVAGSSDLILTAPSALVHAPQAAEALVSMRAPIDIPDHAITMIWHTRFSEDAGHRWLRQLMVDTTREYAQRPK